jgi:hypothetical protein
MKHTRIIIVTGLLAISTSASAFVIGGSNLDFLGYPKPKCMKPTKPFDLSNEYAVMDYNSDIKQYIQCVEVYIENANNDIERIKEAANDLIKEAKRDY